MKSRTPLACLSLTLTLVLLASPSAVRSQPQKSAAPPLPGSFVYCHRHKVRGLEVFAGAPTNEGALRFGLSVWDSHGFHLGLWGIAPRSGSGWKYRGQMNAADPNARCDVVLRRGADNSLTLSSVRSAVCPGMTYGGSDMDIEELRFDPSAHEGPVTWQLDDGDTFANHAGRCRS